jgi:hypothetical protein
VRHWQAAVGLKVTVLPQRQRVQLPAAPDLPDQYAFRPDALHQMIGQLQEECFTGL